MNNIILSISLLVSFLAGFLVAIKSVQLGLRWNMQTAEKREPELHSPIDKVVEAVQESKAEEKARYSIEQMREWSPFQ
jgi:hypothetical protein